MESEKREDIVWGVAYRISSEYAEDVMGHLDYREKGGYKTQVCVHDTSFTVENVSSVFLTNSFLFCSFIFQNQ